MKEGVGAENTKVNNMDQVYVLNIHGITLAQIVFIVIKNDIGNL